MSTGLGQVGVGRGGENRSLTRVTLSRQPKEAGAEGTIHKKKEHSRKNIECSTAIISTFGPNEKM